VVAVLFADVVPPPHADRTMLATAADPSSVNDRLRRRVIFLLLFNQ
jgi:hypothetical protein